MVKELLTESEQLQDERKRITPSHLVIGSGDSSLVKQCLVTTTEMDLTTDLLNEQDSEKNTLLHLAIKGRFFGLVYVLRKLAKAEEVSLEDLIDAKNKYGIKPSDMIGAVPDLPPRLEKLFINEPKFRGIQSVHGITKPQMEYVNTMGVIAALLATITFTAAFTVPGGLIQEKGTPIFMREATFQIFMFFNLLTMCLSMMILFCLLWIMAIRNHRKSVMLMDFSMLLLQISFYTILLTFMRSLCINWTCQTLDGHLHFGFVFFDNANYAQKSHGGVSWTFWDQSTNKT